MKKLVCFISIIGSIFGTVIKVPYLSGEDKDAYTKYSWACENPQTHNIAFNGEYEFCKCVKNFKNRFNLTMAVETGTWKGGTTSFLATVFDRVDTYEVVKESIKYARARFKRMDHVHIHPESSGKKLGNLLSKVPDERIFFYLDAHWWDYWPLKDEIRQIAKYFKDNCIIMIDDAKVPGYDNIFSTPTYPSNVDSYGYVKEVVDELFTSYKVYYLITEREYRGKLLLIPDSYTDGVELTVEDFM